jgi:hypothetical protein
VRFDVTQIARADLVLRLQALLDRSRLADCSERGATEALARADALWRGGGAAAGRSGQACRCH